MKEKARGEVEMDDLTIEDSNFEYLNHLFSKVDKLILLQKGLKIFLRILAFQRANHVFSRFLMYLERLINTLIT